MNIGILLIATGKYDIFVKPLIESARKHLFKNHNVTFFVFTDSRKIKTKNDIIKIKQIHWKFPIITLFRYKIFVKNKEAFEGMDYLYYSDVDMLFVDEVGDEAIGIRVGTIHPGYCQNRTNGSPERNQKSTAYIPIDTNNKYYAGGFNGGSKDEFLKMSETINNNIDVDIDNKIIAVWHDESHLNRYLLDNPPTTELDSGYCYGESMNLPYRKRLLALDKDHQKMRT